ncbi:hypothetical protein pb186bvf_009419 [Paramecium bursaria]
MNFNISNNDDYENVTIQLNLLGVKAFQIISIEHLDDIELKIQRDQQKNFRYKIIPFYLNNFVKYLNQHNNKAEIRQLEDLHDNIQKDNYSYERSNANVYNQNGQIIWKVKQQQTLCNIFNPRKQESFIQRNYRLLKINFRCFIINHIQDFSIKKENYQEVNEKFESIYEVKSKDDLLEDIMPQRKMVITDALRK